MEGTLRGALFRVPIPTGRVSPSRGTILRGSISPSALPLVLSYLAHKDRYSSKRVKYPILRETDKQ